MQLLLLNDRITFCMANVVGKKNRGRGYACSRYTTSDPDLLGKYEVNSRYTEALQSDMTPPRTQNIMLSPTEPVPLRMLDAGTNISTGRAAGPAPRAYLRVEYMPVPIIMLMLRNRMVTGPTE